MDTFAASSFGSTATEITTMIQSFDALKGSMVQVSTSTKTLSQSFASTVISMEKATTKWGDSIAGAIQATGLLQAGVTAVLDKAKSLSAEADASWKAAGLQEQSMAGNLAIGYGLKDAPKIVSGIDQTQVAKGNFEHGWRTIAQFGWEQTHPLSAIERARNSLEKQESEYEKKLAAYGGRHQATTDLSDAFIAFNQKELAPLTELQSLYHSVLGKELGQPPERGSANATTWIVDAKREIQAEIKRRQDADKAELSQIQKLKPDVQKEGKENYITEVLNDFAGELALKQAGGERDFSGESALKRMRENQILPGSPMGQKIQAEEKGNLNRDQVAAEAERDRNRGRSDTSALIMEEWEKNGRIAQIRASDKGKTAQEEGRFGQMVRDLAEGESRRRASGGTAGDAAKPGGVDRGEETTSPALQEKNRVRASVSPAGVVADQLNQLFPGRTAEPVAPWENLLPQRGWTPPVAHAAGAPDGGGPRAWSGAGGSDRQVQLLERQLDVQLDQVEVLRAIRSAFAPGGLVKSNSGMNGVGGKAQ